MESKLAEALLWTIFVQKMYLLNKFRVLRNYWLAKQDAKKKSDQSRASHVMTYVEVPELGGQASHLDEQFDSTEIAVSQEIFDLYKELKSNVDEFVLLRPKNSKKLIKNREVVLYIKLKLEILYQSQYFQRIAKIQASKPSLTTKPEFRMTGFQDSRGTLN